MAKHEERAHSRFSASGAERWLSCPSSVYESERNDPLPTSEAAEAGTFAHEALERVLTGRPSGLVPKTEMHTEVIKGAKHSMIEHLALGKDALLHVEEKVSLSWIHEDLWGTLDVGIAQMFGVLKIKDFKYGRKKVSPVKNLQLIFYALGLAKLYDFNFDTVELEIMQRGVAKGYTKPWVASMAEVKKYEWFFKRGVDRVLSGKISYAEGPWCYFCQGQKTCPKKVDKHNNKALTMFNGL